MKRNGREKENDKAKKQRSEYVRNLDFIISSIDLLRNSFWSSRCTTAGMENKSWIMKILNCKIEYLSKNKEFFWSFCFHWEFQKYQTKEKSTKFVNQSVVAHLWVLFSFQFSDKSPIDWIINRVVVFLVAVIWNYSNENCLEMLNKLSTIWYRLQWHIYWEEILKK